MHIAQSTTRRWLDTSQFWRLQLPCLLLLTAQRASARPSLPKSSFTAEPLLRCWPHYRPRQRA